MSWSPSSIQVYVPSGATTGPVTITESGVTSNGVTFTVSGPPAISSISPEVGAIGSSVTISGTGFGSAPNPSVVTFYGVAASTTSWSDTQIVATVPAGTVTGEVDVKVAGITGGGPTFTVEQITYLTDSLGHESIYTHDNVEGDGTWLGKIRTLGMKVKATDFDGDSSDLVRSIKLIAGKWKVKIICHLFGGTKRFSELRRLLAGVHRGTLTYELRGLHADGIISRTQYPTIPPTVEYKLTARGAALRPVLIAVQRWSKTQELAVAPEPAEKKQQPGR